MLVADDELDVRPIVDFGTAPSRTAEECETHSAGVDGVERGSKVADELVGAGKANLRVTHSECGHALQEQHSVGDRDLEVRLLQPVAQAGVKELDLGQRGHFG